MTTKFPQLSFYSAIRKIVLVEKANKVSLASDKVTNF